jgi:hypothetical protein
LYGSIKAPVAGQPLELTPVVATVTGKTDCTVIESIEDGYCGGINAYGFGAPAALTIAAASILRRSDTTPGTLYLGRCYGPVYDGKEELTKSHHATIGSVTLLRAANAHAVALLAGCLCALPCRGAEFHVGAVDGLLDLTAAYGLGVRVDDPDEKLVAIANGGKRTSANQDDGTLNYDKGVFSNALRLNADLTLAWQQFGAYVRGFAFYDYENQQNNRARTPLSADGEDIVGEDADLLDHYVSLRETVAGVPVVLHLGDQVVNWGESGFVRDGIDIINPLDLSALNVPATPARDVLIPQGMLWGAAALTTYVAAEAYYQYEWKPVRLPPLGSYFSGNDLSGGDGLNFAMLGAGRFSDLGTDLDSAFALPPGTLGFDPDFFKLPGRGGTDTPGDGGQFGVTLSSILPGSNATKLSAHLVRYHSRLPLVSGLTASQAAIDQTSQAEVDALAASLESPYLSTGLTPGEAADAALATAEALTTSQYANQAGYKVEYPEDITMIGVGFNTATLARGMLISGEVSHHINYPFQISLNELFAAALSPIQFTGASSPLGTFGADQRVKGFVRLDRTQATVGLTQLFGSRLGASQTAVNADFAWVHVHDMPGRNDLPLQAVEPPSADSWGYRLGGSLTYAGVLGGLSVTPAVLFTHDVRGTTPAPVSTFLEERKSFTAGVGLSYINRWTGNLSYTSFFGAGDRNLVNDRDLLRLRISYTF